MGISIQLIAVCVEAILIGLITHFMVNMLEKCFQNLFVAFHVCLNKLHCLPFNMCLCENC